MGRVMKKRFYKNIRKPHAVCCQHMREKSQQDRQTIKELKEEIAMLRKQVAGKVEIVTTYYPEPVSDKGYEAVSLSGGGDTIVEDIDHKFDACHIKSPSVIKQSGAIKKGKKKLDTKPYELREPQLKVTTSCESSAAKSDIPLPQPAALKVKTPLTPAMFEVQKTVTPHTSTSQESTKRSSRRDMQRRIAHSSSSSESNSRSRSRSPVKPILPQKRRAPNPRKELLGRYYMDNAADIMSLGK